MFISAPMKCVERRSRDHTQRYDSRWFKRAVIETAGRRAGPRTSACPAPAGLPSTRQATLLSCGLNVELARILISGPGFRARRCLQRGFTSVEGKPKLLIRGRNNPGEIKVAVDQSVGVAKLDRHPRICQ